jgi:hypothetical protein
LLPTIDKDRIKNFYTKFTPSLRIPTTDMPFHPQSPKTSPMNQQDPKN